MNREIQIAMEHQYKSSERFRHQAGPIRLEFAVLSLREQLLLNSSRLSAASTRRTSFPPDSVVSYMAA